MAEKWGTIMLVDDDRVVREVLAENLSNHGFLIIQAENGEEAVALAIQHVPDLIISDIIMPIMDGWDLCYTLRLMPSTKGIPFVFLTSLDKTPDKIMGIKLGADDYLTKPFTPAAVVFKIKGILKRMELRRQLLVKKEAEARDTDGRYLISDVIEYLRHTHRTGLLAVYGPSGKGVIYIHQGKPLHATYDKHEGETAVYEILRLTNAQVKFVEEEHPDLKENITITWDALMARVLHR